MILGFKCCNCDTSWEQNCEKQNITEMKKGNYTFVGNEGLCINCESDTSDIEINCNGRLWNGGLFESNGVYKDALYKIKFKTTTNEMLSKLKEIMHRS